MYGLTLSGGQLQKIVSAVEKHASVTIRLTNANFHGNHKLPLTQTQINRLNKTKTGMNLKLSYSQIKHIEGMASHLQ